MEVSKTHEIVEYQVEPVHKKQGETEPKAIERMVLEYAGKGFELVEACGDEIRMPNLIFARTPSGKEASTFKVEEVKHIRGKDEVDEVRERLLELNDEGWFPLCVMDSPLTPPIAIFKKVDKTPATASIDVVLMPISILGHTAKNIEQELLAQQLSHQCSLRTVMASGLTPVLIFVAKEKAAADLFLVEHAKGGIFSNASRKLTELIRARSLEGWQVCGAFEDETLMPCVVFRRPVDDTPRGA
jgi:hypothetical protein